MIDSRTRCCCGGCPIRGGTMAAAIFLIVKSAIILIWSIVGISRHDRVSSYGGTLVSMGLLILAASLVLWGLKAREYWPCIFIIVLLSLGLIGWCYWAAISGIAIGVLGNCNDRETFRSITFNDPDGSFRHLSSSYTNNDCNIAKGGLFALLIVSLICVALYIWFIYIFSKAIGYIKYLRINAPPVIVGTINTGYVMH